MVLRISLGITTRPRSSARVKYSQNKIFQKPLRNAHSALIQKICAVKPTSVLGGDVKNAFAPEQQWTEAPIS